MREDHIRENLDSEKQWAFNCKKVQSKCDNSPCFNGCQSFRLRRIGGHRVEDVDQHEEEGDEESHPALKKNISIVLEWNNYVKKQHGIVNISSILYWIVATIFVVLFTSCCPWLTHFQESS